MASRYDFSVGQKVSFSGQGEVIDRSSHDSCMKIRDEKGNYHYVFPGPGVEIQHKTPAEWPPRLGDVWHINGRDHFARRHRSYGGKVMLTGVDGDSYGADEFTRTEIGKAKLIHRRTS